MSRRASLAQPQSALKAQGTPALETSILALGRFKRRKRQPSVIRLVQLEAEAEAAASAESELDVELDLDLGMDDFNPDDESTPLHLTSTRLVTDGSSSSRKRKRHVSDEDREMPSSPPFAPPSKIVVLSSDASSELSNIDMSEDDRLPRAQFEPLEPEDHDPMSETNAPPLSTSPERSPPPEAAPPRRGARRGPEYLLTETLTSLLPRNPHRPTIAELDTAESSSQRASDPDSSGLDMSSATEIPSSPPRPAPSRATRAAARATTRAAASAASTIQTKAKIAAPPPPTAKTRASRAPLGERRDAANAPVQKRGAAAAAAGKRAPAVAASRAKKRAVGGRRGEPEGKENEADDTFRLADSSDSAPAARGAKGKGKAAVAAAAAAPKKKSAEMERMKRKFAEVDAWQMDFESVDMGGTSGEWR
jgi:hypothetical protein